jgi:hypothetical protein
MKKVERTITIHYEWWRENGKQIKKGHVEALDETAINSISESINEGLTEGELSDNIVMLDSDPDEGVDYRGWWEVKKV